MNFMFEWQEQEHKIHIFEPKCDVLLLYVDQIYKIVDFMVFQSS